jgi:N-acetylglucosaminyl-diphospho-decaprenol L-rhamnosyltransferase
VPECAAESRSSIVWRVAVDLCIVVVAYNSASVIDGLLDSVPAALGGVSAEIVVVDNGSGDGTPELVASRDDCHLVRSSNVGYAGGINAGVLAGPPADAVLVLNPDARLEACSIPPLLAALSLPRTGVVAPKVVESDGSVSLSLRREPSLGRAMGLNRTGIPFFSEYVAGLDAYSSPCVVDWALGAVLMMSRECFDRLGGWDASYFLYSEETDFSLRARDLGYLTRYEPGSVVMHIGGGSGQNERTHAMQIINRVRLYRRRNGAARSWVYFVLTVLSETTWALRVGARSRFAVAALLRPSLRPRELGCSDQLMPR